VFFLRLEGFSHFFVHQETATKQCIFTNQLPHAPESDEDFSASDFSEVEAENSGPTTARSKKDEDNEPARPVKIATKENQAVFWSRALVIAVLILAAAGAASLTYLFTSNAETKVFEGDVSAGPKQRFFSVHFQAARTHMIRSLFITV
jgi:hypothetical protein